MDGCPSEETAEKVSHHFLSALPYIREAGPAITILPSPMFAPTLAVITSERPSKWVCLRPTAVWSPQSCQVRYESCTTRWTPAARHSVTDHCQSEGLDQNMIDNQNRSNEIWMWMGQKSVEEFLFQLVSSHLFLYHDNGHNILLVKMSITHLPKIYNSLKIA